MEKGKNEKGFVIDTSGQSTVSEITPPLLDERPGADVEKLGTEMPGTEVTSKTRDKELGDDISGITFETDVTPPLLIKRPGPESNTPNLSSFEKELEEAFKSFKDALGGKVESQHQLPETAPMSGASLGRKPSFVKTCAPGYDELGKKSFAEKEDYKNKNANTPDEISRS